MASNSQLRRPLMLKDFLLLDDSISCSSSGFNSFPRFTSCNTNSPKLRQSRSRSAICALQKLLSSVKSHHSSKKKDAEIFVQVRVKDILRWRSFRDLIDGLDEEEKALPLDCFSASSENGRSRFEDFVGEKRNVGGEDPMMAGTGTCNDHVGPTESEHILNDDDEEQQSPISVLHSPFSDDEDSASSFDQSLSNVERTKQRLLESIKWLESLAGVDPMDSEEDEIDLIEEPTEPKTKTYHCKDNEAQLMKDARANLGFRKEPEMRDEMEECVREMDEWSRFEEQTNQLGAELELGMLNSLLDELLYNLVARSDGF